MYFSIPFQSSSMNSKFQCLEKLVKLFKCMEWLELTKYWIDWWNFVYPSVRDQEKAPFIDRKLEKHELVVLLY